ncbi:hypothetical protein [Pedobacter sp. UC225_65]|uniref:hypothetical protein n=1 Tax=Pedobacter sp. UC225_65 TaxID=3350173 RepID=UPI00366B09EC
MKKIFRKYYTDLFLGKRLFIGLGLCVCLFLFSFFIPILGHLPYLAFGALMVLLLIDFFVAPKRGKGVFA